MIDERKQERPPHEVRVVPTAGGDWIAACSDCDFEITTHLKVDAEMDADMHANPTRGDGSGREWTGRKLSTGRKRR